MAVARGGSAAGARSAVANQDAIKVAEARAKLFDQALGCVEPGVQPRLAPCRGFCLCHGRCAIVLVPPGLEKPYSSIGDPTSINNVARDNDGRVQARVVWCRRRQIKQALGADL